MSADFPWLKLYSDLFDNPKLQYMLDCENGQILQLFWIHLLTLANKANGFVYVVEGVPYPYETLAKRIGMDSSFISYAIEIFERLNMITVDDSGVIYINNWEKYQATEKREQKKEQDRIRQQNHRDKKNNVTESVTSRSCHADVTLVSQPCHADVTLVSQPCHATDIEEDKDIDKEFTHTLNLPDNLNSDEKTEIQQENDLCACETDTVSPKISENYAKQVFDVFQNAELPCANGNFQAFAMREFYQALPVIRELHLSSAEVIQAVKNYAQVVKKPDSWWASRQNFYNFCSSKTILRFIPGNFDMKQYENKVNTPKHGSMVQQLGLDQTEEAMPF